LDQESNSAAKLERWAKTTSINESLGVADGRRSLARSDGVDADGALV
jgi:hypothetical protein